MDKEFKSGFVSMMGRTNVGKSSIMNALVNEKVAAIANKPQTTRNAIRAIVNRPNSQIIFIDTPGIHKPKSKLGNTMVETAFGVANDDEGYYNQYKTADMEQNALYIIKAHPSDNTEAYVNAQNLLNAGKLQFLVDERTAKSIILSSDSGALMRPEERQKILLPYTHTSILRDELVNLKQKDSVGTDIKLIQGNI